MQTVAQLRMQPFSDQASMSPTNRKSRLNFNVARQKALPKIDVLQSSSSLSSITQVQDPHHSSQNAHTIQNSAESFYTHSNNSDSSSNSATYNLTKMETNSSIISGLSLQQQYKVQLKYSKKDIDLIRYTWNKMLLDEPIEQKSTLPGAFPMANTNSNVTDVNTPPKVSSRTTSSTVASSLFCRQLYANLLHMDPNLEKLFPSIKHQAVSFAGVMSLAISQLENLSNLEDYLTNLGKRHSRILGIEPPQFELMGEALIQTFHERFGNRFDQELEVLWIKLYLYLANSILQFGIDPIMRLEDERELPVYNPDYLVRSYEDKRASVLTSMTNVTDSTMANSSMDQMSISTANTSVASTTLGVSAITTMNNPKKFMSSRDNSDVVSVKKTAMTAMKKRKRDCVIM